VHCARLRAACAHSASPRARAQEEAGDEARPEARAPPSRLAGGGGGGGGGAGGGGAATAAKSARRTLVESPRSAQVRRRCLTFETPRSGGARVRGKAAEGAAASAARTPSGGAFATPAPRRPRGRSSLDGGAAGSGLAPPETPDVDGMDTDAQHDGGGASGGGGARARTGPPDDTLCAACCAALRQRSR
jgi:hypothetical protein